MPNKSPAPAPRFELKNRDSGLTRAELATQLDELEADHARKCDEITELHAELAMLQSAFGCFGQFTKLLESYSKKYCDDQ